MRSNNVYETLAHEEKNKSKDRSYAVSVYSTRCGLNFTYMIAG